MMFNIYNLQLCAAGGSLHASLEITWMKLEESRASTIDEYALVKLILSQSKPTPMVWYNYNNSFSSSE